MREGLVVSIFGLGYVGSVSAACLAKLGHQVIGVDINRDKVAAVCAGRSPVVEPRVDDLIQEATRQERLTATTDSDRAVAGSDVIMICVGTPANLNGSLDTKFVLAASRQIGSGLRNSAANPTVVFRSTMLPGRVEEEMIPLLEEVSGKRAGKDFSVAVNPEFLRQGSGVEDFFAPPFTLVGANEPRGVETLKQLYAKIPGPFYSTDFRTSAIVKYACNAFHGVKITFANEIGLFCKAQGVDSHRVMEILCQDIRLNISPAYLRPGFAFGGSCLPKDLSALLYQARRSDVSLPMLEGAQRSNEEQIRHSVDLVCACGRQRVGLLGLSFKSGTDDFRGSPLVLLAESLVGKGYQLKIYDPDVVLARLVGTNKQFVESVLPHLSSMVTDHVEEVVMHAETIVVGKKLPELRQVLKLAKPGLCVIDLVRLAADEIPPASRYYGIGW